MRRILLGLLFGLAAAFGPAPGAQAHDADILMYRPYVIEKTCYHGHRRCKAKMRYAHGQNPGLARPGTYFYQKARKGEHGDFRFIRHKRHDQAYGYGHRKHWAKKTRDRDWCRGHVWGFDTASGTFAGGVPHRARCVPSYDTR